MDDTHFKLNPRIIERIKYERLHAHARRLLNTIEIKDIRVSQVTIVKLKYIMRKCESNLRNL